jgi:NTE family protein
LRKRQVVDSLRAGKRAGAYWGIGSNIADYRLQDSLPCPVEKTRALAAIPTRLKRLDAGLQERLINWGYAICDAALRRHLDPALPVPSGFPYPSVERI